MNPRLLLFFAPCLLAAVIPTQAFQVAFANNTGPATVKASNSGASSTTASPQDGAICVNMYVFNTAATLQSCCSCLVPANSLVSLPVPGSGSAPLVIKLVATVAAPCTTGSGVLATGLLAWVDTAPFASATHTQMSFTPATLSAAELAALAAKCTAAGQTTCSSCPVPPALP